jgi:hypothetical protein
MKYNRVFRILALAVIFSLLMLAIPATPVLAANVSLSPTSGVVGTTVTVTGTGFEGGTTVYIYFSSDSASLGADITDLAAYEHVGTDTANSYGDVSYSFDVPDELTDGVDAPEDVTSGTYYVYTAYSDDVILTKDTFAVAVTNISISPTSGYVGDTVTVSGTGFTVSSTVTIYFDSTKLRTVSTNSSGAFSGATITVPQTCRGSYTIKAVDTSGSYDTVTFTVSQKITVSSTSGGVGDTVTISGTGFTDSSTVTIYFDSTSVGTTSTDDYGTFSSITFTIPSSYRGSHTIKARDGSGYYATAAFTVAYKITIAPTSGVSGTTVTVKGTGFSASTPITIWYNRAYNANPVTTTPASISTDANGSFTASFAVPAGLAGTYPVEVSDGTYSASANFTATIEVTTSPVTTEASPGHVGMDMTISGKGFIANHDITITYESETATFTTKSLADGSFSYTFTVPPSKAGAHTITASDGTNSLKATFIMESKAPPTPKPLLPLMGDKAKSKAYFDWEDVTDDSLPVTYTLHIASDADFKTMLVEKTGLTTSEYTLTDEQKLESTKKEAPYYWRVRAIDAASNASDWSGAGTFYVGFIFPEIKGWLLYVLIGVGALVLFFLGLWVGRRRGGGGSEY